MDSQTQSRKPTTSLRRGLSAPIVAALVASLYADDECTRRFRNLTLKNCMLVSHSFAHEFRPHLYHTLYIVDAQTIEQQWVVHKRLCRHNRTMLAHPEYQKLVKKVIIALDAYVKLKRSLVDFPEFPSWIETLPKVSSVAFTSLSMTYEALSFRHFPPASVEAISRLCSRPSVQSLSFSGCYELPSQLISNAPKLTHLTISGCASDTLSWDLPQAIRGYFSQLKSKRLTTIRIETESHLRSGWEHAHWSSMDEALSAVPSLRMGGEETGGSAVDSGAFAPLTFL
ncbi:hypothetical protein BKA70DRAFT_1526844 [Coprinopsis sp. MPI-PUGE-AT-0042]|nr:hypothetical protein BKA70DRAFT_1526844 [Coprinopsis sp. MPI-PUGE-AT-0042]